jgi:uncharacterized protein YegJ (DUF2314 family)
MTSKRLAPTSDRPQTLFSNFHFSLNHAARTAEEKNHDPVRAGSDAGLSFHARRIITAGTCGRGQHGQGPKRRCGDERRNQQSPRIAAPVLSKLASPGSDETGFSLKVRIDEGDIGEHFWLIDIERKGDLIFGTINNTPDEVKSVAMGQRIQIDPARISDWMYMRNRKIVGNETMRALLLRMPKRQADAFRTMLETP